MSNSHRDSAGPAPTAGNDLLASTRRPLTQAESDFAHELFERHRLSLYRYLTGLVHSREEAREILQETYLRLLRQPSFHHLRENARAYLFQTATNLARDLFRQRATRGGSISLDASGGGLDSPDWISAPDAALEGEQAAGLIVAALGDLHPDVRTALLLHRFRDLTHNQIATRLGVSERTIERYIKEGLTAIALRLEAKS